MLSIDVPVVVFEHKITAVATVAGHTMLACAAAEILPHLVGARGEHLLCGLGV